MSRYFCTFKDNIIGDGRNLLPGAPQHQLELGLENKVFIRPVFNQYGNDAAFLIRRRKAQIITGQGGKQIEGKGGQQEAASNDRDRNCHYFDRAAQCSPGSKLNTGFFFKNTLNILKIGFIER
ncbi:hypothetical protein SDC9_75552 [bioreactor metagenome]|uniref:Uncharacterized protein n=1 Tax=bioreactor metagenome TaxID=1076179 RepID=A0A644YSH0_9ZZZZ